MLMQRIEHLEVTQAEYSERIYIAGDIAKQLLKDIREKQTFID
jgi:hypothetical protein